MSSFPTGNNMPRLPSLGHSVVASVRHNVFKIVGFLTGKLLLANTNQR